MVNLAEMAAGLVAPLAFYQRAVRCSSRHIPRHFRHFLGSEFRQSFSVSGFLDTYLSEDPQHSTHHQDLAVTFQANSDFSDSFWRLSMQLLKWQCGFSLIPCIWAHIIHVISLLKFPFFIWTSVGFVFKLCLKRNCLFFSVCELMYVSTYSYSHSARVLDQPDLF